MLTLLNIFLPCCFFSSVVCPNLNSYITRTRFSCCRYQRSRSVVLSASTINGRKVTWVSFKVGIKPWKLARVLTVVSMTFSKSIITAKHLSGYPFHFCLIACAVIHTVVRSLPRVTITVPCYRLQHVLCHCLRVKGP